MTHDEIQDHRTVKLSFKSIETLLDFCDCPSLHCVYNSLATLFTQIMQEYKSFKKVFFKRYYSRLLDFYFGTTLSIFSHVTKLLPCLMLILEAFLITRMILTQQNLLQVCFLI